MADATTRLTISAQVKGMSDATKDANKLKDSLEGIGKSSSKSGGGISKTLKSLRKELRDTIKDSNAMGHAYEAQGKQLKWLQKEYDLLAGAIKKTRKERKEDQAEQAQAAKAASVFGRISSFFRGGSAGGGGDDGDGGRTSGPGKAKDRSFAQGFLQALVPQSYIERNSGMYRQAAGNLVGRTVRDIGSAGLTMAGGAFTGSQSAVGALATFGRTGGILSSGLQQSFGAAQQEGQTQRAMSSLLPFIRSQRSTSALTELNNMRSFVGPGAMRLGGLSENEGVAMMAQMAASAGGLADNYGPRTSREALAAVAGRGIDVGSLGALARGEELGASVTKGSSSTSRAIADADSLKLQGSEIGKYVRDIASNIERFGTTGIKVDTGATGSIGRLLQAQGGYSGVRAAALAGGISSTLDSVAGDGPQNGGQFLMLQAAGYDPKNPESFYAAQERIDNATPGDRAAIVAKAQAMAKKGLAGMSRLAKGATYRNIAGQMGENLRIGEAIKESGTTLSEGQTSDALAAPNVGLTQANTDYLAERNTFQSSKDFSSLTNADSATGQAYLPKMLEMDAKAKETLKLMSSAGSGFLRLSGVLSEIGNGMIRGADMVYSAVSSKVSGVTTTGPSH